MPHSEADGSCASQDYSMSEVSFENEVELTSDEDKPVPFPRTTSCAKEWVRTCFW